MTMVNTPISQTTGTLGCGEDVFLKAIKIFNEWGHKTAKMPMPVSLDGNPASALNDEAQVEIIALPDVWASRFQTFSPDERTWTVETFLKRQQDDVLFATRLFCLHDDSKHPQRSIPGFVKRIVTEIGLFDEGLRLKYGATELSRPAEVAELAAYIKSPKRIRPVFVATIPKGYSFPVANVAPLAKMVGPLGHFFVLPDLLTYSLTKQVGPQWAVFGGSLRTFFPGFRSDTGNLGAHPLLKPSTLQRRQENPRSLPGHCLRDAAETSIAEPNLPLVPQYETFRAALIADKRPQP